MKYVYTLIHKRKVCKDKNDKWVHSTKEIGIYTTEKRAKDVIEIYKKLPGFRDYPDDFIIEKIELDFDDYDFI